MTPSEAAQSGVGLENMYTKVPTDTDVFQINGNPCAASEYDGARRGHQEFACPSTALETRRSPRRTEASAEIRGTSSCKYPMHTACTGLSASMHSGGCTHNLNNEIYRVTIQMYIA